MLTHTNDNAMLDYSPAMGITIFANDAAHFIQPNNPTENLPKLL